MGKFNVMQNDFVLTTVTATDENHAWQILNRMGIRNRSKTLELVSLDNDDFYKLKRGF